MGYVYSTLERIGSRLQLTIAFFDGERLAVDSRDRLNALNRQLMKEITDSLRRLDEAETVRVIVITGNEKAFAAGADIKEMADKSAIEMLEIDQFETWDRIGKTKKPIIAAVSGFALGGGCELAGVTVGVASSNSFRRSARKRVAM